MLLPDRTVRPSSVTSISDMFIGARSAARLRARGSEKKYPPWSTAFKKRIADMTPTSQLPGPIQTMTPVSVAMLMSIAPRSKAPDLVRHFRQKKVRPARKATSGEVTTVQDASLGSISFMAV